MTTSKLVIIFAPHNYYNLSLHVGEERALQMMI